MKMAIFAERGAGSRGLGDVAYWNIQDSRRDEWPLLGAFNQGSQSPAPPGERLMGTGYFIRLSTSLPRIWGCNYVCFCCCFVLQADKEEPSGWSSLGRGSQGAIRRGRSQSRKGKRVKKAWRFRTSVTHRGLNWMRNIFLLNLNPNLDLYTVLINSRLVIRPARWSPHRLFTLTWSISPFSSITQSDCSDCCRRLCFYQQPFPPSDCPATPYFFHCNTACQKHSLNNEFLRNYWWTLIIECFAK